MTDNDFATKGPAIPPKERFDLPEVLQILAPGGFSRIDLYEYLRSGRLRTVCFPYRLEPKRQISIQPDQWEAVWKDAWSFPVYEGWIGDEDIAGMGELIPLHIVADAVDADLKRKLADGKPAAQNAPVYILREELIRFVKWMKNPSKSRPVKRRSGGGRPQKHDYTVIDGVLEDIIRRDGSNAFRQTSIIIDYLRKTLGETNVPPESTLRNHIKSWLKKK